MNDNHPTVGPTPPEENSNLAFGWSEDGIQKLLDALDVEGRMSGDERYDIAAVVAAQVTNLLGGDYPGGRAELFGKVVYLILDGIYEAEKCVSARRFRISDN